MKLKIFPFKKVKSTNSTAIRLIKQNIKFGVVTSERQYKGRGQGTNRWISNYGNIFLSIFFPIKIPEILLLAEEEVFFNPSVSFFNQLITVTPQLLMVSHCH